MVKCYLVFTGKDAKHMVPDEFSKDCRNFEKFLQLVIQHPAFSNDESLEKFLQEESPPVRTKVKKGVMESLSRSVSDFRHHNHKVKSSYVFLLGENELEVK
ncbi:PREDICTED: uncharacterized protein LOC107356577 [Acropora digitifera]|uniref:uncharacterized protein LOC107356577 n=1 Tax=Acropora digitifera TaxID=70779 RepID=UPI00077A2B64|nr:PREDICTED: uncharacterized protein LOC107356577 [Acropora digitifera]